MALVIKKWYASETPNSDGNYVHIVGPLYYILNKSLSVAVVEASSWSGAISFKRSVIEGQNIN